MKVTETDPKCPKPYARERKAMYATDPSYMAMLYELRRRVNEGTPLEFYDDETVGCKNTECSLGLCDDTIEAAMDGVYDGPGHYCPHDSRFFDKEGNATSANTSENTGSGCFYECHIFKKRSRKREEVKQRIEAAIKFMEERYHGEFFTDPA